MCISLFYMCICVCWPSLALKKRKLLTASTVSCGAVLRRPLRQPPFDLSVQMVHKMWMWLNWIFELSEDFAHAFGNIRHCRMVTPIPSRRWPTISVWFDRVREVDTNRLGSTVLLSGVVSIKRKSSLSMVSFVPRPVRKCSFRCVLGHRPIMRSTLDVHPIPLRAILVRRMLRLFNWFVLHSALLFHTFWFIVILEGTVSRWI